MPCPHGRQRSQCKDCSGKAICEHGLRRTQCKECGGSGLCKHGRRRDRCKECGGCDHVIVLEATEVELVVDDDEEETGEGLTTVQTRVVAAPRGSKRKR